MEKDQLSGHIENVFQQRLAEFFAFLLIYLFYTKL